MLSRLLAIVAAITLPIAACAQAPVAPQPKAPAATAASDPVLLRTEPLIALMKRGGTVLVIRHERTEVPSSGDDYAQPTNCAVQRNLSVAGQAGARETGYALKVLGVRFGKVLASPMCRTMETARLIFGRVDASPRLMHGDDSRGRTNAVIGTELRAQVEEVRPAPGVNDVVVSHIGNIAEGYRYFLTEGEIAVMQRGPDGTMRLVGRAIPSDLGPYARIALARGEAK